MQHGRARRDRKRQQQKAFGSVFLILSNQSNISLYSLYCAEACNELAGPISASLRWATQLLLKKCRSVGNTVVDVTNPRFEPQTSRSRDERFTVCYRYLLADFEFFCLF